MEAMMQDYQLDVVTKDEDLDFCVALNENGTHSKRSKQFDDLLHLTEHASVAWIDCTVDDVNRDAAATAIRAGFSELLVKRLSNNSHDVSRVQSGYEDLDSEMGLALPAMQVVDIDVTTRPILVLLKKGLILTIRSPETHLLHMRRYAETYLKKFPENLSSNDRLTLMLFRLMDENIQRNAGQLQEIEDRCDALSRDLSQTRYLPSTLANHIYEMKHSLIRYIAGHWATADVLSSLRFGDANLLSDDPGVLNRIGSLIEEVHGQISVAEHISEVLASGLECLQSIYNNRLQILNNRLSIVNNRMTLLVGWLTVLGTALLVPNTIATVVSQTNVFPFTQADMGWYLGLIVGSTVLATFLVWWWVRTMGLMPHRGGESEAVPIAAAEKERED
jgi:magnesium transporter